MLEIPEKKRVRPYESILIMDPNSTTDQQKEVFRKLANILKPYQGTIQHVDTWGKRKLANPIRKNRRGVYFHMMYEVDASGIREMERNLKINDTVLRSFHHVLPDDKDIEKHLEDYRQVLSESNAREREREAKHQRRVEKRQQRDKRN